MDISTNAYKSKLDEIERLQMAEINGMHACLAGVSMELCPFEQKQLKDAWLLGYKYQEIELNNSVANIALRQAIKSQTCIIDKYTDVSALKEIYPETWWVDYLTEDTVEALAIATNNKKVRQLETIIKSAISLCLSEAFSFSPQGVKIDNEQAERFDVLNAAVTEFIRERI